ncbi:MocR-like pyridoxine biosynthesis transcription factor PdxR [Williamsia phyllosphaerae]|uniref:GntR family transcriptional regulator n=1 Tax=Williamsia phyllosphaerae TaxID=885042 RepID=A0ABQ1V056_9NOCA|nr:PLP-dependent aminotransferase family protein [Williamsia phyllosphaerae]GGF32532.1 GntR family transcriptional regulator [Williamsia phyllosphaerae]
MTNSWADLAGRLGVDLLLDVDTAPGVRGRRTALAAALRSAITDGRLTPGTALPPYRSLAADLQMARGTVAGVYQELIAEGWLVARVGSATRVADLAHPVSTPRARPEPSPAPSHDFCLGQPQPALFPRTDWIRSTRRVVGTAANSAFGIGDPQGHPATRRSLAAYLGRVRGVRTDEHHIVLTTGVSQSLELLSRSVFGDAVAVESHGLPFHREVIERSGTRVRPIPIDRDGLDVGRLAASSLTGVVLTPSHQYPTGHALAPRRRATLVDWARERGGVIVEDDYDGELRYDRDPIGAVQGLAPDDVIYLGSASKALSPAVRIGWMVVPDRLLADVLHAKGSREATASVLDQMVFADLIDSGAYDRHVRRSRSYYRARRDALTETMRNRGVECSGVSAGLHAVLTVSRAMEPQILSVAADRGFVVAGLDGFRHPDAEPSPSGGIVVGFSTPPKHRFQADVAALADLVATALANDSTTSTVAAKSMHLSVTDCP